MRLLSLALSCLVLSASCGGSSDPGALTDSGMQALRSGDYSTAETDFGRALAVIGSDTAHPQYKRASMGVIQARVYTDAARAQSELLALRKTLGEKVTDSDFQKIANLLGGEGKFTEAITLLREGKKAFPGSVQLDTLGKNLAKQAEAADDKSATSALDGLGYVGD
jgi:hypothetical protein